MKLISCYIENFGGLSQYRLDFEEGLTVIREPNGFGKTTLAEFLRAMFYGFPRATSKTLGKRKKYTPWNGGKFGGTLDFEYQGERYRIQRSFGATPARDKFSLIDLRTGRESLRFSQNIGVELFELDAESFERSTYMPQIHDSGSLTTNTIQAKLGDLVEDTNDINNFDKAIEALRQKRTTFIPFRGNSGTVAEATETITKLQNVLAAASDKPAQLKQVQAQMTEKQQILEENKGTIDRVRQQIKLAAQEENRRSMERQLEEKTAECAALQEKADDLRQNFPGKIPEEAQVEEAEQAAAHLAALDAQTVTTQADLDARQILEDNRQRFQNGVPTEEGLEQLRQDLEHYQTSRTRMQDSAFPGQERLESLTAFFAPGVPEQETLEALAEHRSQLIQLEAALEHIGPEPEDQNRLRQLEAWFADGVPTPEMIQIQKQKLSRIEALRSENHQMENDRIAAAAPVKTKKSPVPVILAGLGVLGIVIGVVLLATGLAVPGVILLTAGLLCIGGGAFLYVQRQLPGQTQQVPDGSWERIQKNQEQIQALEREVREFTVRYTDKPVAAEALSDLQHMADDYTALRQKKAAAQQREASCRQELQQHRQALEKALRPYFEAQWDDPEAVGTLSRNAGELQQLQQDRQTYERMQAELSARTAELEHSIREALAPYLGQVEPEQFGAQLSQLTRLRDSFLQAQTQVEQWQQRREQRQQQTAKWKAILSRFREEFGIEILHREQARSLWDKVRQLGETGKVLEEKRSQLAAFRREHQAILEAPALEKTADSESLSAREKELSEENDRIAAELVQLRQQRDELQDLIVLIPEMKDRLKLQQEQRSADRESARILDETMACLQQARDRLTSSYLGGIQESFAALMERLMGEQKEQILITPELDVRLQRLGEARELAYFSAGQTDIIMICMRFALVDALFGDNQPFVILDDPFVNLDDESTEKALQLLRDLSKERQILYMVCNSSRA